MSVDGVESYAVPLVAPHYTRWDEGVVEVRSDDGIRKLRITVEPRRPIAIDDISWE